MTAELIERLDAEIEEWGMVCKTLTSSPRRSGKSSARKTLQLLRDCRDALTTDHKRFTTAKHAFRHYGIECNDCPACEGTGMEISSTKFHQRSRT